MSTGPMSSPSPQPPSRTSPLPPRRIILEQRTHPLRKVFMSLLAIGLVISLMANMSLLGAYHSYLQRPEDKVVEHFHSGTEGAKAKIAIIALKGVILEGDGFVKNQIDRVRDDENVKAIVLRVDSPGGTVTGSEYIYHHLKKLAADRKIPLVVSMGSVAASGGYYISMAVGNAPDTIYAEETTWTGSIGVLLPHFDLSELLTKWNIKDDSFASAQLKEMGSMTRSLTDEQRKKERAVIQTLIDESFAHFKEIVAAGRPKIGHDPALMAKVTTGQVFSATQAKQLGLVDKLGFIEDAIEGAATLAKLKPKSYCVVEYYKPQKLLDRVLNGEAPGDATSQLGAVLATPKPYYLFTWLPAVIGSRQE